jgi:hypothetical protein
VHGHRRAEGDSHAELPGEQVGDHFFLHFAVEADRDLAALLVDAQVDQRVGLGQLPQRREQPAAIGLVDRLDHGFTRGGRELAGNPAGDTSPTQPPVRAEPIPRIRTTSPARATLTRAQPSGVDRSRDVITSGLAPASGGPVPDAQLAAEHAAVRQRAVITVLDLVDDSGQRARAGEPMA